MTGPVESTASVFAERWLGDVPGAHAFEPILRTAIATMFTQMHVLTGKGSNRNPDRWLRQAFAVPVTRRSEREMAEHVAGLMLGWLPSSLRSLGTALDGDQTSIARPGNADFRTAAQSLLNHLTSQPTYSTLGTFPHTIQEMAVLGAIQWGNVNDLAKMIRDLIRRFANPSSPRARQFIVAATAEIPAMTGRLAVATALAATELAAPPFQSAPKLGEWVHEYLQNSYRQNFLAHRIISEQNRVPTVYRLGKTPTRLATAALQEMPVDFSLAALIAARISPFSATGVLKDDLVDLTLRQDWEIKPARSSPQGVLQETWYRLTYNFWATVILESGLPVRTDWLSGGVDWNDLHPGLLAAPIPVSGGTVKPFCIDLLPGIVLYWVLRGPKPEDVAAAEALFLAILLALAKAAAERARRLRRGLAAALDVLEKVAMVARMMVAVLLVVTLAVAFLFALPMVLPKGLAIAVVAGMIVVVVGSLQPSSPAQASRESPLVTLSLGSCAVTGLPLDQVSRVMAAAGALAAPAFRAAVASVGSPARPRNVPVTPPG